MKKLRILLLLNVLLFCPIANANILGDIPMASPLSTDLKEQITQIIEQNEPKSKLIRVGIGTNNFASYFWQEATIYATDDYELFNGIEFVDTLTPDETIKITRKGKNFILTNEKNEEILNTTKPISFSSKFGFSFKNLFKPSSPSLLNPLSVSTVSGRSYSIASVCFSAKSASLHSTGFITYFFIA